MKRLVLLFVCAALLAATFCTAAANAEIISVYTTGNANVRTGPGTQYASLGTVDADAMLPYLETIASDERGVIWYAVSYKQQYAWVSGVYSTLPDRYLMVRCMTGDSYLRTSPSLNGGQVATMTAGTSMEFTGGVAVDDRDVAWYSVNYRGNPDIWVSSKYTEVSPEIHERYITVGGGNVNLRAEPNLNGKQLKILHEGDSILYAGECAVDDRGVIWYAAYVDETFGWISSRYGLLSY